MKSPLYNFLYCLRTPDRFSISHSSLSKYCSRCSDAGGSPDCSSAQTLCIATSAGLEQRRTVKWRAGRVAQMEQSRRRRPERAMDSCCCVLGAIVGRGFLVFWKSGRFAERMRSRLSMTMAQARGRWRGVGRRQTQSYGHPPPRGLPSLDDAVPALRAFASSWISGGRVVAEEGI